jgi:hypothetical protein
LVNEIIPKVDILDLLNAFSVGLNFVNSNGILCTNNQLMFPASLVIPMTKVQVVYANQLIGLGFHAVFIAFINTPQQIPCMLYQQTLNTKLSDSAMLYFKSLYTQVMPMFSVPPTIAAALQIGRPDIHIIIMSIYMTWLKRVKRPELIEEALVHLLKSRWEFDSVSRAFQCFETWIENYSMQLAVLQSKLCKIGSIENVLVSKLTQSNITIDGYDVLVASKRDRIFAALLFLFDADSGWAVHGLSPSAPAVFKTLEKLQPYLFDPLLKTPPCLFDELAYLGSDNPATTTNHD